jgi:outer membrane lipoprotein-sorting protein
MRRRAFLAALAATAASRLARADAGADAGAITLDDALARVARARASMKTLVGPFTQERTIGLLATTVTSHGTLVLVRPDRLRWELAPPDDVVYWVTPEGLAYRSKRGQARAPGANARLAAVLDDLRTLLGGDLARLRARYDLRVEPRGADLVFDATPRDPAGPVKHLRFAVDAEGATPRFAEITEGPRDRTRIEFGALQRDAPVDPALVRPPP